MNMQPNNDMQAIFAHFRVAIVEAARSYMGGEREPRGEYVQGTRITARVIMDACLSLAPLSKPDVEPDVIYQGVYAAFMRELTQIAAEAGLDDYASEVYVCAVQRGFEDARTSHRNEPRGD